MVSVDILEVSKVRGTPTEIHGFAIDFPRSQVQINTYYLEISGWVIGRSSPVTSIEVTNEALNEPNNVIASTIPNLPRIDVGESFSEVSEALNSGFIVGVNLLKLPADILLGVIAVLADQSRVRLAYITLSRSETRLLRFHSQSEPKIVFLHIPKTAGTSLQKIVEQEYPGMDCLYLHHGMFDGEYRVELLKALQGSLLIAKALFGHLYFGIHQNLADLPCQYVTILRHPIERVVSYYNDVARVPHRPLHAEIKNGMSLAEMVQSQINNLMTRMLTGVKDNIFCDNPHLVEQALDNVHQHFSFVGLTERFSENVNILGKHLGWHYHEIPYLNVNPKCSHHQIDSNTLTILEEHNRLDRLLYEHFSNSEGGYFLNTNRR